MLASSGLRYSFHPKEIGLVSSARPEGYVYRISAEEWPTVADIYRRFAPPRNGYLDRDERWWKEAAFQGLYDEKRRPYDAAVWAGGAGEPSGYVIYYTHHGHRAGESPWGHLVINDFTATDP